MIIKSLMIMVFAVGVMTMSLCGALNLKSSACLALGVLTVGRLTIKHSVKLGTPIGSLHVLSNVGMIVAMTMTAAPPQIGQCYYAP